MSECGEKIKGMAQAKERREWEQRGKHLVVGAGGGATQELEIFHGLGGH